MTDFTTYHDGGVEYLERAGTGETVLVLLHGIGSNAGAFAKVVSLLPPEWRVIAWNAPGYGGSAPLPGDWPLAGDYADALAGLIERLGLGSVFLAGHSLGCLMGAALARARPGMVRRLLLASPARGHGVAQGSQLSDGAQARIDDLAQLGPDAFAAKRAARLVHDAQTNPDIVAAVETGMAAVRNPGYSQASRMLASGRLLEDVARVQCKTDVLVGACDVITPPDAARQTHAALPETWRGSYTEVPACGHAIHQQAPKPFAAALQALCAVTPAQS